MKASTTARKASTTARWASALLFLVGVSAEASAQEPADSATSRSGRSVDATALPVAPGAGAEAAQMEAIRERLAAFGDWFHRAMDLECSGRVPVARLVEITNPRRDQPQQIDWNLALDVDDDGFVEPGEVGEGIWEEHLGLGAGVRHGQRELARMLLFHLDRIDSDEDGAVTREELTSAIEAAGGAGSAGLVVRDRWGRERGSIRPATHAGGVADAAPRIRGDSGRPGKVPGAAGAVAGARVRYALNGVPR